MIQALPHIFGLLESLLLPESKPTGEVRPDSSQPTSGHLSGNLFANILRDQSLISSFLKDPQHSGLSGNDTRLSEPEWHPDRQLPAYQDISVESTGPASQDRNPSLPTGSIPFLPLEGPEGAHPGEGESWRWQAGLPPAHVSRGEFLSNMANTASSPHALFAGEPGPEGAPVDTGMDRQHGEPRVGKEPPPSLKASDGAPATQSGFAPEKATGDQPDRVSRIVQDDERLLRPMSPPPAGERQATPRPSGNQASQAPFPFQATPSDVADGGHMNQVQGPYSNGISSLLREMPGNGQEAVVGTSTDLPGDSGLPTSGDRSPDVIGTTGKGAGADSHGGQGLPNGPGGFSSQSGFQHSSSSLFFGGGTRMPEERATDLPAPALQRLQMDVQVSASSRIQIDVGVHNRQVYTGLLMDQATLKNLAVQFVPQLQDQLGQIDMELQEFSAEVREQRGEQDTDMDSPEWGTSPEHGGATTVPPAPESFPHSMKSGEEKRLHLVA
jgi:hypothetical protein